MRMSIALTCGLLAAAAAAEAAPASFSRLDTNKDNRISVSEARNDARLIRGFAAADLNGDGMLDRAEFARQLAGVVIGSNRG